jgi:hypothetical protein
VGAQAAAEAEAIEGGAQYGGDGPRPTQRAEVPSEVFAMALSLASSPRALAQGSLPDSLVRRIDSVFTAVDRTVSPGCALAIYRDGEIVYSRGYGMASLEFGVAISPRTVRKEAGFQTISANCLARLKSPLPPAQPWMFSSARQSRMGHLPCSLHEPAAAQEALDELGIVVAGVRGRVAVANRHG